MKHQLRTIIAAMLLLVTATGARASESLVETRQTGGHEVTVEATYSLRQEYSWDELFENVSTLNDINTCVTRTHPVVCLEMKLKGNYFLSQMKNKEAVSAVYVEWDNRWYKLGTITSYFAYYRDTPFSKIRTQFFRTHNYKSMANQWGYFFTTMFKNEQITSSCMPFYYVPSSTMIKQAAEGKCSTFRLKIENEPTTETVNNGDQYKVSYIINCSINYAKPKDITLRHASMTSLELQMGDQRLFDINDCRELNALKGLVRNEFKYSGLIDYPTKTNGFGNVDANSRHSLYYDLKKEGLYDFKLRSIPYEQLTIQIQDDARMVYEYGVHKYLGNEIECGYTVSWPRLNINTHIKLHASTPPFAYFDNSKVNIRWSPETDLRSYLIAYRAESPEDSNDAEANLEDADWKFLEKTFVGFGRSIEITDNKPIAYNKRYTYAFLQLPFTGSDNVDFTPYVKDTRKLEKGLIVCTTQVVVTPKMTVDIVQDKSVGDKISLNITPSKLPVKEAKQSYDVYRRAENETEWKKLETLSIANDGKTTATYTDKDVEGCNVYLYKVSTYAKNEDLNLDNLLESDSVRLSVLERSHVTKLDVSKGDRESSVMVNWEARQIGSKTTTYLVQRRLVNTNDEFVTIHTAKGTANRYTYEDKSVDAGQFYDYRIEAYTEGCDAASSRRLAPASASNDPDLTYSNSEGETGFCMSKGIISGRVSYGSGTSVEGVKIFLTPQEDDQEAKIVSHSQKLSNGGTIQWATTAKEMRQLASQKQPFTVQLYLHPEPGQTSQPIVTIPGLSPLRVTTNDSVATLALGSQTFTQELSSTQYNHITLTVDGTDVTLTLNGDTAHTETVTLPDNAWFDTAPDKDQVMLTLGGGQLHGYMREMRLWTRVLTPQETATTYDRTLSGLETGLAIYWPLDEGLVRHTFDISCTGGVKNKRHPYVDVNVRPDTWVPTSDQLSLYGITNKNGEYTIRSVSFTGTGTNYVIRPEKPLHEFQPATLSGFVSKQLLSLNNNDFKDMSSFEYRGTVRYLGTDIPVDSVTFEIDGQTVMLDNKPVMTDINGQYTISVPIGSHAIKATRNDHVLTRYPETGTLEFTEPGIINLTDSTLVNVAGRINGGADNDTIPLGFRLATNRIGVATMTLRLEREANNRFNLTEDRMPSGKQKAIPTQGDNMNSHSYYPADAPTDIVIQTDPKTGEFSAMLPPLRYVIKSITFPNGSPYNDEKFFRDNLPAIDARLKPTECKDTLVTEEGKQKYETWGRLLLSYRSEPIITVGQSGMPLDAFGSYDIADPDDDEKYICLIDTVTEAEAEANPNIYAGDFKNYKYTDRPVFEQGRRYSMKIYAQEQYHYYDSEGTLAKTYKILPPDGVIHINNMLSTQAIVADSTLTYNGKTYHPGERLQGNSVDITLPKDGGVVYTFICGSPNFNGDRTVPMTVNLEANKKQTLWEGALPQKDGALKGYIVGSLLTGTRFLTKGPDAPTYILRDPGGAQSSATLQNDTVYTSYNNETSSWGASEKFVWTLTQGAYIDFVAGVVAGAVVTAHTSQYDGRWIAKLGEVGDFMHVYNESDCVVSTYSEKVSTGTDASHCGRKGDTYLGIGTNIYYGEGRYLKFKKKNDGSLFLTDSTGITSAMELGTSYNYSEYHLENNLLPEWKRLRNLMLEHVDSWANVPSPAQIRDGRPHYYTIYKEGDEKYGTTNPGDFKDYLWTSDGSKPSKADASYIMVVPADVTHYVDTISSFNVNINNWRNIIAKNEDDKIAAIEKGGGENISFSGGNTITRSKTSVTSDYQDNHHFGFTRMNTYNFGVKYKVTHEVHKIGWSIDGHVKGVREVGHKEYYTVDRKQTVSYTLADNNYQAALSISVYDSPAGWGPVFINEGGQTLCPYEGGTKCEYSTTNKGRELDKATMRVEKCDLLVENANVSDVPSGDVAVFNIYLYNNSEVQEPGSYTLIPHPSNNLNGGQIMLDGEPIPSEGISYWLPYGEYKKTLMLKQTDLSVTDYKLMLRMQSTNDTIRTHSEWRTLTAHFVPTSAPVDIESDLAVINVKTDSAHITLRNLDRNFQGLKGVRLLYRRQGTDNWTEAVTWINEDYRKEYPTAESLPATGNLKWPMLFKADGIYELQAQTFAKFGSSDVTRNSETIILTQDQKKPQYMSFSDMPSGLTLINRNDIHITFDEPILRTAVSQAANVRITEVTDDKGLTPQTPHVVDEADYKLTISDNEIYFSFRDAVLPKMHNRIYQFKVFDVPDQYGNPSDTITWLMHCDFMGVQLISLQKEISLQKGEIETTKLYVIAIEADRNYTLSGQPSWVKLSKTSGITGNVASIETVDMTILPTAPIGVHDFDVTLTEPNGISSKVSCHVTVEGTPPEWSPYPSLFENNMIVIGSLKAPDGTWSTDKRVLVGAFDSENICRGITYTNFTPAQTTATVPADQPTAIANLLVGGDEAGDDITIRIYDEKTGLTYDSVAIVMPDGTTKTTLKFSPDTIIGSYTKPVAFQTGEKLIQVTSLKKGWNWVSFYLDFNEKTIRELLTDYSWAITCIKNKDKFCDLYIDPENVEIVFGGDLANDKVEMGLMYKIYSECDVQLALPGSKPSDKWQLKLNPGWNWIGVTYHNVLAMEEAFRDPTLDDFVKSRSRSATYNDRNQWEGTLKVLLPGEGYLYRSMADHNVIYNQSRRAESSPVINSGDYSDNMTIVMQPLKGDAPMPNTEVSVYIGETLRARATTNSQGICYLTVAGNQTDAEAEMTIRVGESETVVPHDMWYGNDAIIGNTGSPYILQLIIPDIASR